MRSVFRAGTASITVHYRIPVTESTNYTFKTMTKTVSVLCIETVSDSVSLIKLKIERSETKKLINALKYRSVKGTANKNFKGRGEKQSEKRKQAKQKRGVEKKKKGLGVQERERIKEKGDRERGREKGGDDNGIPRNVISIASVIDQVTCSEYGN